MAPSILTKHMTLRTELPPSPEMEPGSKTKREKDSRIAVRQLTTSTSQMSCKGRQPGPYLVIEAFEPILCSAAVQNVRDPVCEVVAMICVEPQRGLPVCYRHGLIKVHDSGRSADLKIQESQDLDLQRSDINSLHHPMGHGVEGSGGFR